MPFPTSLRHAALAMLCATALFLPRSSQLLYAQSEHSSGSSYSSDCAQSADCRNRTRIAGKPVDERLQAARDSWYEGNPDLAVGVYEDLIEAGEVDPAREALSALYREHGRYTDAISLIAEILDGETDRERILGEAIELTYLAARPEETLEYWDEYRELGRKLSEPAERRGRITLFAARAAHDLDMSDYALGLASEAISIQSFFPLAYELRGRIEALQGRHEAATRSFAAARSQEPNLTHTLVFEAESQVALEQYERARALLTRAVGSRPHDTRARDLLTMTEERAPQIVEAEEEERSRRREVASPPAVAYHPHRREEIPFIRVGLAEELGELWMKSGSAWRIIHSGGSEMAEGSAEQLLRIYFDGMTLSVEIENEPAFTHDLDRGSLTVSFDDDDATVVLFDLEHSQGQFSAGSEDRAYRGSLEIMQTPHAGDGFTVVNELDIESYLYSVVPSEIPASWPTASLEAQAIAARSYTIANLGRFESRGFDVFGSVRSAFYRGYSGESARTTEAVDATRGEVLEHDGSVLTTYYSANNAGHTDSPSDVWGGEGAGYQSVADPQLDWDGEPRHPHRLSEWLSDFPESYSAIAPFVARPAYRWELWVDVEEIADRLNGSIGEIESIRSEGRSPAGRVHAVSIRGTAGSERITGDAVRRVLGGLRSNLFVMQPVYRHDEESDRPRAFVFRGGGWGHGIGMDQTGAAGYASLGAGRYEILEHYYPLATPATRY